MQAGHGRDPGDQSNSVKASFHSEISLAKERLKREQSLNQILGESRAIQGLRDRIRKVADCDVSVLLTGESGVGKELAARAIHYLGHRAGNPFVPINCGAIPETLFENELFGHAQGAYTDAKYRQVGLLGEAAGGTVFLDEISTMTPFVQVKLLRLLEDKTYRVLGEARPRQARVRIIVATNKDLRSLAKRGEFREDLFYRLSIVSLSIPPLRERKEDIPLLVKHFVLKYARDYHKTAREVSPEIMRAFQFYSWPGNIRELENRIQELVVMSSSRVLQLKNALFVLSRKAESPEPELEPFRDAKRKVIESFENSYLLQLLADFRGDVARAARRAGKSRTSLWNLIKKHSICPKDFRGSET